MFLNHHHRYCVIVNSEGVWSWQVEMVRAVLLWCNPNQPLVPRTPWPFYITVTVFVCLHDCVVGHPVQRCTDCLRSRAAPTECWAGWEAFHIVLWCAKKIPCCFLVARVFCCHLSKQVSLNRPPFMLSCFSATVPPNGILHILAHLS